jgi:hypothetical protein
LHTQSVRLRLESRHGHARIRTLRNEQLLESRSLIERRWGPPITVERAVQTQDATVESSIEWKEFD